MEQRLYSIRDRKSGYLPPVVDVNDETAKRNFAFAIQRGDSMYLAFPDDYDLYFVGTYETESGEITPCNPLFVASARSFLLKDNPRRCNMAFRTQFDRIRKRSESGKRFKDLFSAVVSDSGSIDLEKVGIEDTYAIIQSFKAETDINAIIERFTRGDMSALSQKQPMYGDFTDFPKTYAEAQQKMIDATNIFMSLPLEERAKYNHNPAEFIADIGSEKWQRALGIWKEPNVNTEVSEKGENLDA